MSAAIGVAFRLRQLSAELAELLALAPADETPEATFEGMRVAHDALLEARRALESARAS
ncbi:MAG: hypothetical protein IE926_14035 [Micrococcales bacterium]|nr:hypothetical protein [Micrococcales bacterium]